jgi:hypothetical protein
VEIMECGCQEAADGVTAPPGAQHRDELITPQPQGSHCVIGGYRMHPSCFQRSQADRYGAVAVSLAAIALGEHPDPGASFARA